MTNFRLRPVVRITPRLLVWAAACAGAAVASQPLPTDSPPGWRRVGQTASATVYVQSGSLEREGQIRRVVEMQSLKEKDTDGVLSRRYTAEYECRHEMVRIGRISSHAGPALSGQQVFEVQEMGYWRKIAPGTPFARLYVMVCGDYEGPPG